MPRNHQKGRAPDICWKSGPHLAVPPVSVFSTARNFPGHSPEPRSGEGKHCFASSLSRLGVEELEKLMDAEGPIDARHQENQPGASGSEKSRMPTE